MKSICIKTNSTENINYLLSLLDNTKMKNICYSCNKFKNYKNIIIHCKSEPESDFISTISEILSFLVLENYEESLIKKLIFTNYFYFDMQERNIVFEIALNLLSESNFNIIDNRQSILYESFYDYLSENNQIVLDGFLNFRIKKYLEFLNNIIDDAVNHFIVEREYWEFISLLKVYINSESSSIDEVHLIYNKSESILLDNNKNVIEINENIFKAKYLSDITFSSNDYTLNTLLNLVPKKIYVYTSENIFDEFLNTLQLIFEDRVTFCEETDKLNQLKTIKTMGTE